MRPREARPRRPDYDEISVRSCPLGQRAVAAILAIGWVLVLAACAPFDRYEVLPTAAAGPVEPAAVERALAPVRSDPEIAAFLDANVWVAESLADEGDIAHLLIRFDEPVKPEGIWDRTCDVADGLVSGAHFVVDLAEGTLLDVSPRWGPRSCIGDPGLD